MYWLFFPILVVFLFLSYVAIFLKTLCRGEHDMSQGEINEILTSFRADKFAVGRYHLMTNNCNHFSDAFIFALLGVHIPAWVNRAANIGAAIIPSGLIPSDNAPVAPTSTTDLSTKALPPSSSLPQLGEISRSRSGVKDVVSVPASASTEEKGYIRIFYLNSSHAVHSLQFSLYLLIPFTLALNKRCKCSRIRIFIFHFWVFFI